MFLDSDTLNAIIERLRKKEMLTKSLKKGIEVQHRIQSIHHQIHELENTIKQLKKELDNLENHEPNYLPEETLTKMKLELEKIEELEAILASHQVEQVHREKEKSVAISKECPICMEDFQGHIFNCVKCNKLFCQTCHENLRYGDCPTCRVDLRSKPMQRCKVMEQIMRQ